MFAVGLFLVTVGLSLYLWGMIRTALWILPTLGFPELGPIFGASLITFWTLGAIYLPYQSGFFDGRDLPRSRWVLIFLATGIITTGLVNPDSSIALGMSLLSTPIILLLFHIFKHPPSRSLQLPIKLKWVLLGLWIFCALLRIVESRMQIS